MEVKRFRVLGRVFRAPVRKSCSRDAAHPGLPPGSAPPARGSAPGLMALRSLPPPCVLTEPGSTPRPQRRRVSGTRQPGPRAALGASAGRCADPSPARHRAGLACARGPRPGAPVLLGTAGSPGLHTVEGAGLPCARLPRDPPFSGALLLGLLPHFARRLLQ